MIFNFHVAVEIILSLLTIGLASYGCFIALKIRSYSLKEDLWRERERLYYLLSMIIIILLVSRVVNLFYFYYVLLALVPIIPGAMCPYGVLMANPIGFLDIIIKLLIPFFYLLWLIFDFVNKKTEQLVITNLLSLTYLLIVFPLLIIDGGLDWLYFWFLKPIVVNCCRNVYNEANEYNPLTLFGSQTGLLLFCISMILLFVILLLQYSQKKWPKTYFSMLIVTIITTILVAITIQEYIAPVWIFASKDLLNQPLGEPHHCPFCLIKRWPSMIPYIALVWLGLATVGWQGVTKLLIQKIDLKEMKMLGEELFLQLRVFGMLTISGSFVILIGHCVFFLLLGVV